MAARWLRAQTEKQRIIWGYKVLFLDVLFPAALKKVIYVDSDQIVQADVGELWDLDLGRAAVAMTPFCRDAPNDATTGFRSWEQGFWAGALGGRPYHISALFVVDLAHFRRDRAGDAYRSTYHALTADPNSLANLDQDLPNYLQHEVPILPLAARGVALVGAQARPGAPHRRRAVGGARRAPVARLMDAEEAGERGGATDVKEEL